ncbi:ATP-binding protein [Actinomadura rubrisoli]|uniref:ATP-binding protein n=1 Tax=Actinomadura rubrisoli TaxID=2530368 RepID=UPI003C7E31C3
MASHLFEPFRRLTRGEGVGLGLSIVASIARAHGGEATARANPDGGLTVRIAFDAHVPEPAVSGPADPQPAISHRVSRG